jgi:hypothetical protein
MQQGQTDFVLVGSGSTVTEGSPMWTRHEFRTSGKLVVVKYKATNRSSEVAALNFNLDKDGQIRWPNPYVVPVRPGETISSEFVIHDKGDLVVSVACFEPFSVAIYDVLNPNTTNILPEPPLPTSAIDAYYAKRRQVNRENQEADEQQKLDELWRDRERRRAELDRIRRGQLK